MPLPRPHSPHPLHTTPLPPLQILHQPVPPQILLGARREETVPDFLAPTRPEKDFKVADAVPGVGVERREEGNLDPEIVCAQWQGCQIDEWQRCGIAWRGYSDVRQWVGGAHVREVVERGAQVHGWEVVLGNAEDGEEDSGVVCSAGVDSLVVVLGRDWGEGGRRGAR